MPALLLHRAAAARRGRCTLCTLCARVSDAAPSQGLTLEHTQTNAHTCPAVLAELSDIVDLPERAAAVEELLADDAQLVGGGLLLVGSFVSLWEPGACARVWRGCRRTARS